MKRNLALLFVGLLTFIAVTGVAPAGPGDSDPLGPLPHVVVHAPASLSRTATSCVVYVHTHHMECGPGTTMGANGQSITVQAYELVDRGNGSWDEYIQVDLTPLNLSSAANISWQAHSFDFCTYEDTVGTAVTTLY